MQNNSQNNNRLKQDLRYLQSQVEGLNSEGSNSIPEKGKNNPFGIGDRLEQIVESATIVPKKKEQKQPIASTSVDDVIKRKFSNLGAFISKD